VLYRTFNKDTLPVANGKGKKEKSILDISQNISNIWIINVNFGGNMSVVIKESTDFKDSYYDISDFCHKFQEPVIITRNGVSDLAVMTIETYEEITGIRNLINLLEEADNDIENGNFLTEEEMDKKLELL
jgi:PHD/YefM family antitoxin component YafN of YafNO toxin-antitoxin module